MDEFADSTGADGDPLQGSPAAGQQRETALAEAAGRPVQGVVGLVVRREDLCAGGLIAEEAGALVTGLRGAPAGPALTLAAGPGLHPARHDLRVGYRADDDPCAG